MAAGYHQGATRSVYTPPTMSADPSLINVTAKVAAYYRQFTDIPFALEAAARIGADAAFEQIRDRFPNRHSDSDRAGDATADEGVDSALGASTEPADQPR